MVVRLRISVTRRRSLRVLVMFPLIITGLAAMCAALLMCVSSLTVASVTLTASGNLYAESRLSRAQLQLLNDLRNDTTAGLASVSDGLQQGTQSISFESRFEGALPLPRSHLRTVTAAAPANVPNRPQQGIQFIRFDVPTLAPMAL